VSDPFIGEIKLVAFGFPPRGWALCNGQLLPINQNQALFSLLGTMYGGNGQTNFALPDLRGRVPLHVGQGYVQGQVVGEEAHTLTTSEVPSHVHAINGTSAGATTEAPGPAVTFGTSAGSSAYAPPDNLVAMDPGTMAAAGGSQPHENRQPYLVLEMCIALVGVFPSRD
jgi:microcystin-dependent protein